MHWNLDKTRPICPQICEQICGGIVTGELKQGQKLLSVRDLALEAGVNPNTVQKALVQLETLGVIYSVRGSGWYVSDETAVAGDTVRNMILKKTNAYLEEMSQLGISLQQTLEYIQDAARSRKENRHDE